jgi:hypothetical protein
MADTPGKMKYAVVEIDTVDYAEDAQTALLSSNGGNVEVYQTLVPDGGIVDSDSPQYTFQLAGAQGTALYTALLAAEGTVVDVVLQAEHGTGKAVRTFSVRVPEGLDFGGTKGQFRTFDLTMTVVGSVARSVSA